MSTLCKQRVCKHDGTVKQLLDHYVVGHRHQTFDLTSDKHHVTDIKDEPSCLFDAISTQTKIPATELKRLITKRFNTEYEIPFDSIYNDGAISVGFPMWALPLMADIIGTNIIVYLQSDDDEFKTFNGKVVKFGHYNDNVYIRYRINTHYHAIETPKIVKAINVSDISTYEEPKTVLDDNLDGCLEEHDTTYTLILDLFSKSLFKDLDTHTKTLIATSIFSSLTSITTSVVTFGFAKGTTTTKIFNGINIAVNLTNTANAIALICHMKNINFDTERVLKHIPEVIKDLEREHVKPQMNSPKWIYVAITTIISLIVSGITIFSPSKIKDIITGGHLTRASKEMINSTNDMVNFFVNDLLKLDITGDTAKFNEILKVCKRAGELACTPTYQFIRKPELKLELFAFSNKSLDSITRGMEKETQHKLRTALCTLTNNLSALNTKKEAITSLLSTRQRIETVGVLIAGDPGIGKSYMIGRICQEVARIMGYSPDIYDLDRNDGFYIPYKGQHFGIVNEFMARRNDDPTLPNLNKIISGDPFNFESAHLEHKQQPCDVKLVFLTANDINPTLTTILTPQAARAVFDRLIRVWVEDPLVQGRNGLNEHRQPDFSHLNISYTTSSDIENVKDTLEPITYSELAGYIVQQMCMREKRFIQSFDSAPLDEESRDQMRQRMKHIEAIINPIPNAVQNFFVVRMQGPGGVGKTQSSSLLANRLAKIFHNKTIYNVENFEKPPTQEGIYLLDDIVYEDSYKDYFSWINKGNNNNIYIITTNEIIPQSSYKYQYVSSYLMGLPVPKYYFLQTNCASGIARRIGLTGNTIINGKTTVYAPDFESICVNFEQGFKMKIQDKYLSQPKLEEHIFVKYNEYIKNIGGIEFSTEQSPIMDDYDVYIKSPSREEVIETLSNTKNATKAYLSSYKQTTIRVNPNLVDDLHGKSTPLDWIVPEKVETEEEYLALFKRMSGSFARYAPGKTFCMEAGTTSLVYMNNIIYYNEQTTLDIVKFKSGVYHLSFQNTNIMVSPDELANYIENSKIPLQLQQHPPILIQELVKYYKQEGEDKLLVDAYRLTYQNLNQIKIRKSLKWYKYMVEHPIISICVGLVTVAGTLYLGKKIYNLITSDNIKRNSMDDENDPDFKDIKRKVRSGLTRKDLREAIADARNYIREKHTGDYAKELERKLNDYEYDIRSNSNLTQDMIIDR